MDAEDLPPGWAWATLGELIDRVESGKNVAALGRPPKEGETGIVKVSAVTWGEFDDAASKTLFPGTRFDPDSRIAAGDFLISRANTLELVGAPVIVKECHRDLLLSDKVLRLRFKLPVERWVELYLKSGMGRRQIEAVAQGAQLSMRNISQTNLRRIRIPLAPRIETGQILGCVDEALDNISAAEYSLMRARIGIDDFRASLLHAACTGQLTAAWRAANPPAETGADLLARILAERRAAWERTELARLQARGTPSRGNAWKARYAEPVAPDLTDMPDLPEGWVWASLDQLSRSSSYGSSVKCNPEADGLAVLRIPNVQTGTANWSNLKFATTDLGLDTGALLAPGDLLIVRTNGSPTLVGRAGLVETAPPISSYFASYLIRFRLAASRVLQKWIATAFGSGLVRMQVGRFAATSAGQYNISQTNLAAFALPLPSEVEMQAALDLFNDAPMASDDWTADAEIASLRQSILHAAFAGRLVPQDPGDEPAAALLTRLRATATPTRRARRHTLAETPA